MKLSILLVFAVALGATAQTHAVDRLDLDGTAIFGNRELPKVLYIAPWEEPGNDGLNTPPVVPPDDGLEPIDRDIFRRQIEFYNRVEQGQKP